MTSTAIITTPANDVMTELHDRMPLILEQDTWDDWLLGDDPSELLRPAPAEMLTWHPVNPEVGNTRNEGPHLIDPIED